MRETQHTPGPWEARDYLTADGDIWVDCISWRNRKTRSLRGGTVATVLKSGVGPEGTLEANARLIAAAPELYARLADLERAAQAHLDSTDGSEREYLRDECFKARAAIAKATGP